MASHSQASSSQARQDRLGTFDVERKADDLVHLLLVWEQRKIPIKRSDINKHILKEHKGSFSEVLKNASKKLEKVFGMKLVEIGEGSKKCYILVSLLEHKETQDIMGWQGNSKRGLLLTILTLIFMSGNQVMDGAFWNSMKKLGIEKDKPHPVFGDVKKLIMQEFHRQMYLDVTKVPNSDPAQYEFRWGLRAYQEISKRRILKFVTKLYDKSEITAWKSQYQDMISDENANQPE